MSDSPSFVNDLAVLSLESGATLDQRIQNQRTQLLAQAPYAVLCLDRSWRITFANVEAIRLSRLVPDDLYNKTYWDLFPDTAGTILEHTCRDIMRSGVPAHLEYCYERFNLTMDIHVFPTEDGIAIYYNDISDRKQAEKLRDEAVRRLEQVFDAASDSIVCIDRNWNCTFANRAAHTLLKSEELVGANLWTAFPSNQSEPFASNYRSTMEQRIPTEFEAYYPAPLDIWFKVSARPYEDGIIIFSSNITDRKRAEALRDSSVRQLQQVLAASNDGIVVLDREWTFTFANRQAISLLDSGPLVGLKLFDLFPGTQEEPFLSNYRATMQDRAPTEFEAFYGAPLNLWLRMLARPFGSGIILFFSDISPRKKAEARRDAASRQLQQVLEATSDAVVTLSRDWTFTFANRRALELLDATGDPIGKNLWEAYPGTVYEGSPYVETYHRAMDQSLPGDFEAFYGEPLNIWLSVQARPYDDGIIVFFRDVTAERAYRQMLLDQQATLAFVQETARVATWEIDLATGDMGFTSGSYRVFGNSFPSIKNVSDIEHLVGSEQYAMIAACTQKAIDTGEVSTVDYHLPGDDSSVIWVESRGRAVYDTNGVATHLRGMTTDITARKKNEEELATSEQRYRVLTELNPQGIWRGSPDGSITYANQGFLDYIGLSIDQLNGSSWLNAFDPGERKRVTDAWSHSIATGDEYDIEALMVRARDGASRWWWLRALPVRDDSGAILHWLGVAIDIHDSKTAADALHAEKEESERQRAELETIYETAPVGLALFDSVEFRYLRVNDRQAETIGLPKDQILGRPVADIAPLRGLQELFERAASGRPVRNQLLEGELPSRPGEQRFWNVSYSPVHSIDGKVAAIAAVVLEMTNQKKAEAALVQSEKLAAVGRLASSISHEINNPLEAITNLLYLVGGSPELSSDTRTYVQLAQSELSRVCQIATQTLRFHRQSVNATRVTAQDLVEAVLNLYQGRLANSGIAVSTRYASRTTLLCFENDIRQVLNNLIANAIDAMRLGGGRLIVRAHDATVTTPDRPTPRRGVRITIADTGHGMSPTVKARVFEPFYTTKELNGTGLGLWISEGIVQRHLGKLSLRSSQDPHKHGTVFSLFLPQD
jgi:PAS domain S-box-containing protein